MIRPHWYLYLLTAMLLFRSVAVAQIPVEFFAGHQKATLDILFFKYFKNKAGGNSQFLFFNRNRVSVDYKMTRTTKLPSFGFTEAISYNNQKLKGFAPVLVAQIFSSGVYSKAGIQFVRIRKNVTLFTWTVAETKKNPMVDVFFLGRYTPALTNKIHLFSQLELVNALPTYALNQYAFTQRIRIGLKIKELQFGLAADFSELEFNNYKPTQNIGGFLRYEY